MDCWERGDIEADLASNFVKMGVFLVTAAWVMERKDVSMFGLVG